MSAAVHPSLSGHPPWFAVAPGETDTLLTLTAVVTIAAVILLGVTFFWLHSLPERMGHKKLQFEIVAVLGLLALFTHMHIFWVIGLLLALVDLPDVMSPIRRIADAAEKRAGMEPPAPPPEPTPEPVTPPDEKAAPHA